MSKNRTYKDTIYKETFKYDMEKDTNHCDGFILESECPAKNTSKAAHPLIALGRCALCREKLVAFCVDKLDINSTNKLPCQIIQAGAQKVAGQPKYAQDIEELKKTIGAIYKYKAQTVETANEQGM